MARKVPSLDRWMKFDRTQLEMKPYLKNAGLVLLIGLAWLISGYLLAGAVSVAFFSGPFFSLFSFQGALVNVLIGLILIAVITFSEQGRRLCYEGISAEGLSGLKLLIIFLVGLPILCVTVGIIWLGLSLIAQAFGFWRW